MVPAEDVVKSNARLLVEKLPPCITFVLCFTLYEQPHAVNDALHLSHAFPGKQYLELEMIVTEHVRVNVPAANVRLHMMLPVL